MHLNLATKHQTWIMYFIYFSQVQCGASHCNIYEALQARPLIYLEPSCGFYIWDPSRLIRPGSSCNLCEWSTKSTLFAGHHLESQHRYDDIRLYMKSFYPGKTTTYEYTISTNPRYQEVDIVCNLLYTPRLIKMFNRKSRKSLKGSRKLPVHGVWIYVWGSMCVEWHLLRLWNNCSSALLLWFFYFFICCAFLLLRLMKGLHHYTNKVWRREKRGFFCADQQSRRTSLWVTIT